jgi:alanine racemase
MTLKTISSRPTRAVIDLSACRHNLLQAKQAAPGSKCMAIIKANGYGHGMVHIAHALKDADAFGVATVSEALGLREAGITKPIVLLEGFSSVEELNLIRGYQLECVIHDASQIKLLETSLTDEMVAWVKVDTGMHRLGFNPDEIDSMVKRLVESKKIKQPIQLMTHLANADDKHDDKTLKQVEAFYSSIAPLAESGVDITNTSIANSAGILGWPQSHAHWNRPGIMLYGVSPFINVTQGDLNLIPVMTLSSHLIAVKEVNKGESIGYGGTFTCDKDMTIGVVAVGYGDGYPRHAKTGTPVLVNNKRTRLIGRVSMDMICVDLSEQKKAKVGDTVVLWGKGLPIEDVAEHAETIGYELLCGVTQRVEFIYEE